MILMVAPGACYDSKCLNILTNFAVQIIKIQGDSSDAIRFMLGFKMGAVSSLNHKIFKGQRHHLLSLVTTQMLSKCYSSAIL